MCRTAEGEDSNSSATGTVARKAEDRNGLDTRVVQPVNERMRYSEPGDTSARIVIIESGRHGHTLWSMRFNAMIRV